MKLVKQPVIPYNQMFKIILAIYFGIGSFAAHAQSDDAQLKNQLYALHSKTRQTRDSVNAAIAVQLEAIKNARGEVKPQMIVYLDSLYNIGDRNDIEALRIGLEFAKEHPNSMYCYSYIATYLTGQPAKDFYEDYQYLYDISSNEIKQSEMGIRMKSKLGYFKQSKVGATAPNFSGIDVKGNPIDLSQFQSTNYVLLDFWASWCKPCLEELPYIKALHDKYEDSGLKVISITLDEDADKWRTAIAKYEIANFLHFSVSENSSQVNTDYFVYGIPHKVLIDKTGTIIGKWKSSGLLNQYSLESLLKKEFGF